MSPSSSGRLASPAAAGVAREVFQTRVVPLMIAFAILTWPIGFTLLHLRGLSPFFVSNPATLIIILLGTLGYVLIKMADSVAAAFLSTFLILLLTGLTALQHSQSGEA